MALQTKTWVTGDYAYQSWSNGYKIHLTLTEESTSTDKNTSVVSYKFWISNTSNNRFIDDGWSWSISIGGQSIAINNFNFYVYPYNVTQTLASGQITVTHNSDGSLNMPYNVSVPNVKASNKYGVPAMALSGNWALTAIPRAATITAAPNFTDEQNPTITYSNPGGNAVTSLQACIADENGGVQFAKYREISKTGTSYQFVLTNAERNALYAATPNSKTLKVRFYIRTTIGGTVYYNYSAVKTLSIVNANPIVSTSAVDTNSTAIALTGDNTKFIKYYSNVKVTATATAQKGATITSTTGAGTYNKVTKNSWDVVATDSRGNKTEKPASGTLIPYVKLTCNIENTKPDASGNMTVRCGGSYFNGSFGAVTNTLTVQCRYKPAGGTYSDWYTMTINKNGNYYGAYYTFTIPSFNYLSTYTFQCQAVDKLATANSTENSAKSTPVFHWGENSFVFEVPVTFNAGATSTVSLIADENTPTANKWTPALNVANAVSSYSVQQGWYQKIGQCVTIGFQIKATIKSGYDTSALSITGVPFTPVYAAFGGGVAHNINISGGFNFEAWSLGTDGSISARLQPCNNTAAGNLNIASTSYYPSGGGTVTLAGTICYWTNV